MFSLPPSRPALMGILNVTPDSFSDGGQHFSFDDAVRAAMQMVEHGADLVDVGGESTRPGAEEVPVEEEVRRTLPVIKELVKWGIPVSIDTHKPEVARAALGDGAAVVNDVYGFRDPDLIKVCRGYDCTVCIMHMQGIPSTMQKKPSYKDVVVEVREWLLRQADECMAAGVARERIWIDPGIGFGKTMEHNLSLLRGLGSFVQSGFPVLIGVSRKSFIGRILGTPDAPAPLGERLEGTLAAQVLAQAAGARIIRAHDVLAARRAMDVAAAIQNS